MADRNEPLVIVNTKFGETPDTSFSNINGLICAAPVQVAGDKWGRTEWYRLYNKGERGRFLKECANVEKPVLDRSMNRTIFNVYRLLGSMSVLVLRTNPPEKDSLGNWKSNSNDSSKFGTDNYIKFTGYVAVSDKHDGDTGNSFYLDRDKNVLDRYFKFTKSDVDITSLDWSDTEDDLEDIGVNLVNYHYTSGSNVEGFVAFNSRRFPEQQGKKPSERIVTLSGVKVNPDLTDNPWVSPSDGDWNFALVRTNPIGLTISNDYTLKLKFTVKAKEQKNGEDIITLDVVKVDTAGNYTTETIPAVLKIKNGALSGFESNLIGLSAIVGSGYNYDKVKVEANKVKATYEFQADQLPIGGGNKSQNPNASSNLERAAEAIINELVEYDEGHRIDFIFDSGISSASLHRAMADVAEKIKALAVATVDKTDVDSAKNMASQSGVSSYLYRIAPERVVDFGNGAEVHLSLGIDYLECVARNKANLQEFAPVFHFTNAYVADGNLTKDFNKSQRDSLIDVGINTVKRDKFRQISYINDNWTANTSSTSLGNEEQIVRLANRMGWDIQYILDQFLGRLDIKTTAQAVKEEIRIYYNNTFGNQKYGPQDIEIICDETNNRFGDGELSVTVNIYVGRALKKITVYNNILPLTSYE